MRRSSFLRWAGAALLAGFIELDIDGLLDPVVTTTSATSSDSPPLTVEDLTRLMGEIFDRDILEDVVRGNPFEVVPLEGSGFYFETSSTYTNPRRI